MQGSRYNNNFPLKNSKKENTTDPFFIHSKKAIHDTTYHEESIIEGSAKKKYQLRLRLV
jgi:hypothetical protein